jgi:DNA-binding MarR family transcriptional regulator
MRGRPRGQLTPRRAQVLTYWRKHGPCSLGQVTRGCGIARHNVIRYLRALDEMGLLDPPKSSGEAPRSAKTDALATGVALIRADAL